MLALLGCSLTACNIAGIARVLPKAACSLGPAPEELYCSEYWKDLPRDIKSAFAVLGYDEMSWNNGIEPPSNE